jgi:hypothetical protein
MLCILRLVNGEPTGWIIATDPHDARRQAQMAGDSALAEWMYRLEFTPQPGKYQNGDFWLLVS